MAHLDDTNDDPGELGGLPLGVVVLLHNPVEQLTAGAELHDEMHGDGVLVHAADGDDVGVLPCGTLLDLPTALGPPPPSPQLTTSVQRAKHTNNSDPRRGRLTTPRMLPLHREPNNNSDPCGGRLTPPQTSLLLPWRSAGRSSSSVFHRGTAMRVTCSPCHACQHKPGNPANEKQMKG